MRKNRIRILSMVVFSLCLPFSLFAQIDKDMKEFDDFVKQQQKEFDDFVSEQNKEPGKSMTCRSRWHVLKGRSL